MARISPQARRAPARLHRQGCETAPDRKCGSISGSRPSTAVAAIPRPGWRQPYRHHRCPAIADIQLPGLHRPIFPPCRHVGFNQFASATRFVMRRRDFRAVPGSRRSCVHNPPVFDNASFGGVFRASAAFSMALVMPCQAGIGARPAQGTSDPIRGRGPRNDMPVLRRSRRERMFEQRQQRHRRESAPPPLPPAGRETRRRLVWARGRPAESSMMMPQAGQSLPATRRARIAVRRHQRGGAAFGVSNASGAAPARITSASWAGSVGGRQGEAVQALRAMSAPRCSAKARQASVVGAGRKVSRNSGFARADGRCRLMPIAHVLALAPRRCRPQQLLESRTGDGQGRACSSSLRPGRWSRPGRITAPRGRCAITFSRFGGCRASSRWSQRRSPCRAADWSGAAVPRSRQRLGIAPRRRIKRSGPRRPARQATGSRISSRNLVTLLPMFAPSGPRRQALSSLPRSTCPGFSVIVHHPGEAFRKPRGTARRTGCSGSRRDSTALSAAPAAISRRRMRARSRAPVQALRWRHRTAASSSSLSPMRAKLRQQHRAAQYSCANASPKPRAARRVGR